MDIKDIKELIHALDASGVQKFEMEEGNFKIKISKTAEAAPAVVYNAPEAPRAAAAAPVAVSPAPAAIVEAAPAEDLYIVKSPIVGTFYGSSSPGTPAFVKVGDKVAKGDTLCIIEAMKIMNEIESEEAGEIVEILVVNEDIVEYGQPLMKIRR
ncbi:hypothetical protein EAL2_c20890 [Peptoclostridium acidaminophilum DSM 3953]|uniref:Biotin carboxyl carrier protein of acetyl-CoA carboxylase n=1 Tax=Peptoclostridium acidaminophilum DSM 3953 TaxID=1286171 RepID=W8T8Z2_PEPAC|nr:acetyl-CoA carboxylase biotin carboxyl carrier protein [Peptoclostridium acidaminophilum]AHM57370.1 hypothetical protein EAL2_c20890 [Peptoclostridium acidaminophilum DSM 3953]